MRTRFFFEPSQLVGLVQETSRQIKSPNNC
jgi:hypothetical protein